MPKRLALLCCAAAFAAVIAPGARAQDATAHVVTYIEVKPALQDKAVGLLRQVAATARKSDGNLRYEPLQRRERPNHFAIIEAWRDARAQEANAAGAHVKAFREALQPLLASAYDERPHTGLAAGPVDAGKGAKGEAVFVVTHVDFIPPKKDDGIAAIRELAAPSRAEPGALRYDVLQQTSRPNHLTLVEAWTGHAALEKHEVAPHTIKFRDLLLPMSGSLFDQRLYRAIP